MAIPRGFKRGSGGFLQPTGTVPSGRVSGPRAGETVGLTREQLPRPRSAAEKRVLASFSRAQKAQEGLMASLTKAKESKVTSITKAYTEMLKNAPKDKLGNTVMTPEIIFMGKKLQSLMMPERQLTPQDPRVGVEQPVAPLQPQEAAAGPRQIVQPVQGAKAIHASGAEVELTGEQREGPQGTELEALVDGKKGWVRQDQLSPAPDQPTGEGARGLQRFLAPKPEREFQPF